MVEYEKLNIKDILLVLIGYIVIVGQLVFYSLNDPKPPDSYFIFALGIVAIFNKVVPRNKYINIIRYTSNTICLLYGISMVIRLFLNF